MNNNEARFDEKIQLLEELRRAMKEKCRDVNPMSINYTHINEVFNEVRWKLMESEDG